MRRSQAEKDELETRNIWILYKLHLSLTNASILGFGFYSESKLPSLNKVFICKVYVLLQSSRFWDIFQAELSNKSPYGASIDGMELQLSELQELDQEA